MVIYLIGVIVTAIIMLLAFYITKQDIYLNDLVFIIIVSILSWAGFSALIFTGTVIFIVNFLENYKGRAIIEWKSRKKNTWDN